MSCGGDNWSYGPFHTTTLIFYYFLMLRRFPDFLKQQACVIWEHLFFKLEHVTYLGKPDISDFFGVHCGICTITSIRYCQAQRKVRESSWYPGAPLITCGSQIRQVWMSMQQLLAWQPTTSNPNQEFEERRSRKIRDLNGGCIMVIHGYTLMGWVVLISEDMFQKEPGVFLFHVLVLQYCNDTVGFLFWWGGRTQLCR